MIQVPANSQIWLAAGKTDMRKGFDGLAMLRKRPAALIIPPVVNSQSRRLASLAGSQGRLD